MLTRSSLAAHAALIALIASAPSPALAYIGPGAGLGAFAVLLALGAGAVLLLVGLVWFPLKRLMKKRKPAVPPGE